MCCFFSISIRKSGTVSQNKHASAGGERVAHHVELVYGQPATQRDAVIVFAFVFRQHPHPRDSVRRRSLRRCRAAQTQKGSLVHSRVGGQVHVTKVVMTPPTSTIFSGSRFRTVCVDRVSFLWV